MEIADGIKNKESILYLNTRRVLRTYLMYYLLPSSMELIQLVSGDLLTRTYSNVVSQNSHRYIHSLNQALRTWKKCLLAMIYV